LFNKLPEANMISDKSRDAPAPSDIVIPKEMAVFWLDANGCWRNANGRFRHKKISDHFHAAIRKDAGGFFLYQERENCTEKVYFTFDDTALFVFDVAFKEHVLLTLNTGEKIFLEPQNLYVQNDSLYINKDEDRVKFTERSLWMISSFIDVDNDAYFIRLNGIKHSIKSR
jgi:hypothetical protein